MCRPGGIRQRSRPWQEKPHACQQSRPALAETATRVERAPGKPEYRSRVLVSCGGKRQAGCGGERRRCRISERTSSFPRRTDFFVQAACPGKRDEGDRHGRLSERRQELDSQHLDGGEKGRGLGHTRSHEALPDAARRRRALPVRLPRSRLSQLRLEQSRDDTEWHPPHRSDARPRTPRQPPQSTHPPAGDRGHVRGQHRQAQGGRASRPTPDLVRNSQRARAAARLYDVTWAAGQRALCTHHSEGLRQRQAPLQQTTAGR